MKTNNLFRVNVKYKYSQGHFKIIPYWFKTEEEYDAWFKKEDSNQSIRKIITLNRVQDENRN